MLRLFSELMNTSSVDKPPPMCFLIEMTLLEEGKSLPISVLN